MHLFKKSSTRGRFALAALCLAVAGLAPHTALGQAGAVSQNWHVFGIESAVVQNTAVPGSIVSGGNLSVSRAEVGDSLQDDEVGIYAASDLSLRQGTLKNGSVSAGGAIDNNRFTTGPVGVVADAGVPHAAAAEAILAFSKAAAMLEPTSTNFIYSFGGIEFEHRQPGLNVYSITSEELRDSNGIAIPVFDPETDTVIINVSGSKVVRGSNGAVFLGEMNGKRLANILQRGDESFHRKILWNFYEAVELDTEGSIEGSIFAPRAILTHTNGRLNGQVVARVVNLLNAVRLPTGGFAGTLGDALPDPIERNISYD